MTVEWYQILCMGAGGVCFAGGGTGAKWLRRYVLPVLLGGVCWRLGYASYQAVACTYFLSRALHIGYGESHPPAWRLFVAVEYVAATLPLGWTPWQLITPVVLCVLFGLSNWSVTERWVPWKVVEFVAGTLLGIIVSVLLAKYKGCGGGICP